MPGLVLETCPTDDCLEFWTEIFRDEYTGGGIHLLLDCYFNYDPPVGKDTPIDFFDALYLNLISEFPALSLFKEPLRLRDYDYRTDSKYAWNSSDFPHSD